MSTGRAARSSASNSPCPSTYRLRYISAKVCSNPATRTALLDAARIRFARYGFDATGVREIAGDAGMDPALVFRYFGSKRRWYDEALRVEIPAGLAADPHRPVVSIADALLREVVFDERPEFGGEHPLLAMLRSSGHEPVRDELRARLCEDYLGEFGHRLPGADAALRAELIGALLLGLGVLRSVVRGHPRSPMRPSSRRVPTWRP